MPTTAVPAGGSITFSATGADDVPSTGALSVAESVAALDATKNGFLSVYPANGADPNEPGVNGVSLLGELTAGDVRHALQSMAARYSTAAVAMGHNALTRVIRHAEARDLVGRNVATLVETPKGRTGRPSKSLTLDQASKLLAAAHGTRMHAYIALCLATGIRTEEARALRWEHVDLGDPYADPPRLASAAVWRSVRSHGDVKTEKSRRTLALPLMAVTALQAQREREPDASGLVFATRTGEALDAANVRREFRAVCTRAGVSGRWTPRELRHSFVSLMSTSGVPVEEIARLADHSSSRITEVVYRRDPSVATVPAASCTHGQLCDQT